MKCLTAAGWAVEIRFPCTVEQEKAPVEIRFPCTEEQEKAPVEIRFPCTEEQEKAPVTELQGWKIHLPAWLL